MKNKIAVIALLTCIPAIGVSQLPSLGGLTLKASGGADLSGQQTGLVRSYVAGGKDVLSSQAKLLESLGLKDQAAIAQATADSLADGATVDNLKEANKVQSENSTAISDALRNQSGTLDAQSKQTYTRGLVLLASGLIKYTGMRQGIAGFSSGLSSAPPLQLPKLQAGAYIVKTLPGSVTNLTSTLGSAVSFARSHGIDVPQDATAAL